MSESIKFNGKYLDADGVYDHTQGKTQSELNEGFSKAIININEGADRIVAINLAWVSSFSSYALEVVIADGRKFTVRLS